MALDENKYRVKLALLHDGSHQERGLNAGRQFVFLNFVRKANLLPWLPERGRRIAIADAELLNRGIDRRAYFQRPPLAALVTLKRRSPG